MTAIRALTLILDDPSAAAAQLHEIFEWEVDADFGAFASLELPDSIPLWINQPSGDSPTTRGLVIHVSTDDVDASFRTAVERGATVVREPADMDFGERSAHIAVSSAPGVTFDFSRPLA